MLASANTNATTKMITDSADAVAEAKILQQRAERVQRDRLGGRARAAAGHHVDDVEDAEGVERAEEERHEQRRPEQRQRDLDELPPRPGAVDVGRLVQRPIDVLQSGEQQQRDERRRLPDVGEDRAEPRPRRRRRTTSAAPAPSRASTALARPAGLSNMKRQTSAATTVGIAHGSRTAVRTSPRRARHAIQRQRQHQAGGELERHACRRRTRRCAPSALQNRAIATALRRSSPRRRTAGRATACADRAGAATPRTSRGSERARRARWSPSAGSASAHPSRASPRRHDASARWRSRILHGTGGAELHLRQQRAHRRRRLLQRRARLLLARQRPMQRDLQDLRQLAVDRRDRPRHRPFDDRQRIGGGIVSASASARVVVQRRPRRILAGDPRPLDHLLGLQQIVDELVGGVRLIAVRVDGQCRAAERGRRRAARAGAASTPPRTGRRRSTATGPAAARRHRASCA